MNQVSEFYSHKINKVIEYINSNLNKSFSLTELAEVASFSSFHFHRIFLAVTGETVNNFTNRLRLEKAARLLKYSSNSITAVALECGFSSSSTLSRSFKNFYDLSPRDFRKSGKLANSKICKDLFPMSEYILPLPENELRKLFQVQIKSFPERRIAYIMVKNAYAEGLVEKAYNKMISWTKNENIFEEGTFFGMSLDDPMVTPKSKYRYEVCFQIPKEIEPNYESGISEMVLPKCNYAVTKVSGDLQMLATANYYLFNGWLLNSKYEPEHLHAMEIYLDKNNITNWNHFDLEICMPIKPLY